VTPAFRLTLIWIVGSMLAFIFAMNYLPASLVDGHYIPVSNDSFYHARRILDTAANPAAFYEFDNRINYPEGSWIVWPWGYDYLMAQANVHRQRQENVPAMIAFARANESAGEDQTAEQAQYEIAAEEGRKINDKVSLSSSASFAPVFEDINIYVLDAKLLNLAASQQLPPPRSSFESRAVENYRLHFDGLPTVSGFVRPERCVQAQLQTAAALGADLALRETVVSFTQDGSSVTVRTDKDTYRASQLIVAAGAWLPGMLKPDLASRFMVTRQVLYWFRARSEDAHALFSPERFPVYIWQLPAPQSIYGFPATGGLEDGVKLATEQYDVATTPESVSRTVGPDEVREMYETYVEPFFPGLSPVCVRHKVCLYTWVDGARFIIDRHPDFQRVIVASPCSGHGFKFAPVIGEIVADLVTRGATRHDISRFRLARFG